MKYLVHICAARGVGKYIGIITSHDVFIVKDHFVTRIEKQFATKNCCSMKTIVCHQDECINYYKSLNFFRFAKELFS
jgi:hypothetical protein